MVTFDITEKGLEALVETIDSQNEKDYKPEELFQRYYNLEREVLDAKELQKELKQEYRQSDDNPRGIDKDELSKIIKAAASHAKNDNLKEKAEELQEIDSLVEKYSSSV